MKTDTLTQNGVQKLLGGVSGVVLQVLNSMSKSNSTQKYYKCDLSDGYCYYKGCLIVDADLFDEDTTFKNYVVIGVLRSMLQQNKSKQPVIFAEKCQIIDHDVKRQIGQPMPYQDFVKNGKLNQKGNNLIKNGKGAAFSKRQLEEMMDQPESTNQLPPSNSRARTNVNAVGKEGDKKAGNVNNNNVQKQSSNNNNSKPVYRLRLSDQEQPTNRHSSLDNNQNSSANRSNTMNINQNKKTTANTSNNSNNLNNLNYKPSNNNKQAESPSKKSKSMAKPAENKNKGPIQKLPQRKKQAIVKPNQKRPSNNYNDIKSLFVGMENWAIQVRVIFVYPIKTFINKKGVESSLLKITVGDSSGTIECTMFGQTAQRFEGKFKQDQVYQISNGIVTESNYMGKRQLKITITQNTKVCLSQDDDATIPYSQDLSVTVQQLLEVPLGQTKTVVCLVKDTGQIVNITSKAGKQLRKKAILLCDPQNRVEVQVNVWGEKCDEQFQSQPYMIKGVYVSQYNGSRKYTLKTDAVSKIVKQHRYRKFIKDFNSIQFVNHGSDKKLKQQINNLKELNNLMDIQNSKGVWCQLVCSVGAVKNSAKNYYLSCPHCKKKVQEQANSQCGSCHAHYEEARPRYILNVMLSDMYDSCWVTAYDEQAEVMTGVPASEFARLNEQGLQQLLRKIRYKQMKMLLLTKNEEYNRQMRKKTGVIKIQNVNYVEQTKSILARLKQAVM